MRIASPRPRRRMPRTDTAHGRCRPYGRQERAHRDLENRRERGFPQRPHASLLSEKDQTSASHTKFLTLPQIAVAGRRCLVRERRFRKRNSTKAFGVPLELTFVTEHECDRGVRGPT